VAGHTVEQHNRHWPLLVVGSPGCVYVAFQPVAQVLCVTARYGYVTYYVRILDLLCKRMYVCA